MSKLVYKTINEIINGKFMTELSADPATRMKYEAQAASKRKEAHQAGQSAATMKAQEEGEAAEANKKQEDEARLAAQKEAQKKKEERNENFDAQMTPGVPPVGLPPMTPKPPMSMPKLTGTPNYEGGNMTKTQLCAAHEATSNIMASIEDYDSLPDWVKAKITLASEYLVKCESFLNAKDQEYEDSQKDSHMPQSPQAARPPMPPASSPSASAGRSPLLGISLGKVQSVSPGE